MNALTSAFDWTARLAQLYAEERNAAVDFLLALSEFDEKKLWQPLGHASLFTYLHVELGMSKAGAYYRKTGAELVRRIPAVVTALRDGRLCVSSLVELAKVVNEDNWQEVLPRFYGCSRREAQKVAVEISPAAAPPMRDVVVAVAPAPMPPPRRSEVPTSSAASAALEPLLASTATCPPSLSQ